MVPILVADVPDTMVRTVALVENLIRLKMHPDDLAQALFDVYAEHGFANHNEVIKNINDISGKREYKSNPVSDQFKSVLKHTFSGIPIFTQRCYLEEYKDIHPEARKIAQIGGVKCYLHH